MIHDYLLYWNTQVLSLWKGHKSLSVTYLRAVDDGHRPIPLLPKKGASHCMVMAEGFELI